VGGQTLAVQEYPRARTRARVVPAVRLRRFRQPHGGEPDSGSSPVGRRGFQPGKTRLRTPAGGTMQRPADTGVAAKVWIGAMVDVIQEQAENLRRGGCWQDGNKRTEPNNRRTDR
jgi:hypothetical protein